MLVTIVGMGAARAERVLDARSEWNRAHTRIHTDVTIERDDGRVEVVRVPGGVVDGIGMLVYPLYASEPAGDPWLIEFVRSETKFGGDLRWEGDRSRVYVPITSMIVVSLALSGAAWLLRRLMN